MSTWDDKHASMPGSMPGFWQLMPPSTMTSRSQYADSMAAQTSQSELHEMTTYNETSRWSLHSSDGAPSIDEKILNSKLAGDGLDRDRLPRKKSRVLQKQSKEQRERAKDRKEREKQREKEKQLEKDGGPEMETVQAPIDPMQNLPAREREILQRQLTVNPVTVDFKTLYRYASKTDFLIMFISALCAVIAGALLPLMTLIFGSLAQSFKDFFLDVITASTFDDRLNHYVLYLLYLAGGEFVAVYVSTVGFIYTGEHITQKIREKYLAAILRQNIAFFDKLGAGEITTRITADTNLVQDGISEKIGLAMTLVSTFITAFVIGFVKFWKLTLILTSTIFAITLVMGAGSSFIVKWNKQALACYAAGGTVAEEVLSSIRNATAFNTQSKLAQQYDAHLTEAEKWGFKHKALLGVLMGCMMCIVYLNYGLAFWQGAKYYIEGEVDLSSVLTILMGIMIGAFSLGNVAPNVQAFNTAVAAATKIYATIDRESPLDATNRKDGNRIVPVLGNVELRRVKHIYPSRPEVVVMDNVSLYIPAGKTTALVGASGSGKSTIIGLVERFYDPVGGGVVLDGHDIKTLNLRWLRQQISLVSQEPTLFNVSIAENIKHGLIGTQYENLSESRRIEMVVAAAKMANAHDFIRQLPEGYDTNVGERAGLLSGGQKQRIAIARAVVSDPKILLLDEATSALDTKSEGVVQAALERAAEGRTTIVIAHRLSTIKSADNIVVMQEGRIVEQGTHDELLTKRGAYASLVNAQQIHTEEAEEIEEIEEIEDFADDDDELDDHLRKRTTRQLKRLTTHRGFSYVEDPDDFNIRSRLKRQTSRQSASSVMLMNRTTEKARKYNLATLLKVVANFNKEEWKFMLVGLLLSIVAGGGNPTQSIFFSKTIVAMSVPPTEYAELRKHVNFWCLMYLMLGGSQLIALGGQGVAFAYCSEKLVHRARDKSFRTMLRQDIGFFDKDENTSGALTSFLSTETTFLAGLSGSTLGTILVVLTTLIASFSLSLAIGWKLALVCISAVPVLLAAGFLRFWILARFTARAKLAYEKSASYACEATSAIRTVASLTREDDVWKHYNRQLMNQADRSLRSVLKTSILFAASQSFMFLCVALGFWYGGKLISSREYDLFQFFVCFSSVIFGAQSAGTIFSFAPDMSKARNAAMEMKKLFDREPPIDSWSQEGEKLKYVRGAVEFRDVHFRYPTRPEQPVLRGLNLTVQPGQYIALVGPSGCGKSTTIGLLERFYDPLTGSVLLDGKDISSFNINSYRSHLALVSQEPTLYKGTIRENILLGADTPAEQISERALIKACTEANIYNFILSLPDGFNTIVGSKGSMLSGGQKQRVAIARALLRNPKVLLLDEATSALDSESEKVVQAALDNAAKGRTTIAVAHRLSTIQKADCIYVFEGGRIVESGTHKGLMARGGKYAELVNLQTLERRG